MQAIALIAYLRRMKVNAPFMIVAPVSTLHSWHREFEKSIPSLPVVCLAGTAVAEREAMYSGQLSMVGRRRKDPNFPLIITSYQVAIEDEKKLNSIGECGYMVIDDGQGLQKYRSTLLSCLSRIQSAGRLLLSGPLVAQNDLIELWSLINFVHVRVLSEEISEGMKTVFDDLLLSKSISTDWKNNFSTDWKNNLVAKLQEILKPFVLRRANRKGS